MASQLPPKVVGCAAGILIYSFISLAAGMFMFWLVFAHNEWKSYVSMLSVLMTLCALASISQQIHTIARWRDIKTAQHRNLVQNVGNPELNVTGASTGVDLVLFYIQYYTYTANSMLVFFWAVELAYSIFQLQKYKLRYQRGSLIAKMSALVLPAILMGVLRTKAAQRNLVFYMFLANSVMMASMTGAFILLAILIKYIHAKRALVSWRVRYGQASRSTLPGSVTSRPNLNSRTPIYDNWLVIRFTIAFIALGLFQLVVFLFELRSMNSNKVENIPKEPDLSISKAKADFVLFIPGVSAGLLLYVVFGTTRAFRQYTVKLLVPQRWQGKLLGGTPKNNLKPNNPQEKPSSSPLPPPVPMKDLPPAYKPTYELPPTHHQQEKNQYEEKPEREHHHNHNPPYRHNFHHSDSDSPNRSSISWYGARPSDAEAGYEEFSPISDTSTHGTITLQYPDAPAPLKVVKLQRGDGDVDGEMEGSSAGVDGQQRQRRTGQDDEWPILSPAVVTPLRPRPRTREGSR